MYTLLFVVTSAHTLLGPFILMLRLVDQTLCLDQLYSCTLIMLSSLCTPVEHFVVTSENTLLGPVCCKLDTTYTHSWCTHCALISCTAVHLFVSPVSVHSGTVYTTAMYNCTLARASLASVLSTNHRRASIYLLCSDWFCRSHPPELNFSMLTQPFCPAERAV